MKNILVLLIVFSLLPLQAQNFNIVLDAGHGGKDKGAVYQNMEEATIVQQISQWIQKDLQSYGNFNIYPINGDTHTDLNDRIASINAQNTDLILSLHIGFSSDSSEQGVDVFIPTNHDQATSQLVAEQLAQAVTQFGFKNRGINTANFALLQNTEAPIIMINIGYLSNEEDRQVIEKYKELISKSIAKNILALKPQLQ